jgi:hypothetical protein
MNQTEQVVNQLLRREVSVFQLSEKRTREALIFLLQKVREGQRR